MRLDRMTFPQAETLLRRTPVVFLPVGSTEQHGPMGLIGTDAICAEAVALDAAQQVGAAVLPPIAYTPAPFNMGFAGTVSISPDLFVRHVGEILDAVATHGVRGVYVVNAHGANLAPLRTLEERPAPVVRVRSWWDFPEVNTLRASYYGAWEGMHATPSEVAITMALFGPLSVPPEAAEPPEPLPDGFLATHAGDRHGPPEAHRARFPDGRVGSHSALARVEHGKALLAAASAAVAADFAGFWKSLAPESVDQAS
ncbi:MAG: creatininase family protein [Acuticoccus sp.]